MTQNPDTISSEHDIEVRRTKLIILAIAGLVVGLILGWLLIRLLSDTLAIGTPNYHGVVMQSPAPMADFTLTAYPDRPVKLSDFRGKVVLVYFGYTYCPDVCPATMTELKKAVEDLRPAQRDQVQVIMVTVDPARDTPEVLDEYLNHFDPDFLGLSGTEDEIATAAAPFGIYYQKGEGDAKSGYLVDHTATVAALDKEGHLQLIFHFNTPGEDIAADLRRLLKE